MQGIKDMGFEKMTEVQARTIPALLVRALARRVLMLLLDFRHVGWSRCDGRRQDGLGQNAGVPDPRRRAAAQDAVQSAKRCAELHCSRLVERARVSPGTGVIIISPTRELALQIYGVVKELTKHHNLTHGIGSHPLP